MKDTIRFLGRRLSEHSIRGHSQIDQDARYFGLLIPSLLLLVVVFGFSFVIITVYSFLTTAPPTSGVSITIQNYSEFFGTSLYTTVLIDSLRIAIVVTIATLIVSYPIAYFLAFADLRRKNIYILLIILPFWVNLVIRTYSWQLILGNKGLINHLLVNILGLITEPINMLFSEYSITIGLVHVLLPFMILPLYTSLNQIDGALLEASKNLGANKLQTFYQITLPLSMSGVAAGTTIVFVLAFGAYVVPALLGGTDNTMIANFIGLMFTSLDDWGLGSAMSVIISILVLVIVFVFNRVIGLEDLYGAGDSK